MSQPQWHCLHIMGLKDKMFLREKQGKSTGKAKIGSYDINFKKSEDINLEMPKEAIVSSIKTHH